MKRIDKMTGWLRTLSFVATTLLVITGCGTADPEVSAAQGASGMTIEDVEVSELLSADGSDHVVLDVRTPEEFNAGHIPGAVNINIDGADFAGAVGALDRDTTYVVHCAANVPQGRSERAMSVMQELGFARLKNMVGGIGAWNKAGGQLKQP